jgi:peptide/nickel transport system substrate-binding protein
MRRFTSLGIVVTLVLILLAPTMDVQGTPDTGEYVHAVTGRPDSLDPAVDMERSGQEVIQNVYETLIWYNGASAIVLRPMLALEVPTVDNGGISADGRTYTYHLRSDVRFHNGDIMTAEDVAYSIERVLMINDLYGPALILGPVLIPGYDGMAYVNGSECAKAIWAKGPLEVQFNLSEPRTSFNQIMATTGASVVSKRFVEEHGGIVQGERNAYLENNTCGTGPYRLSGYSPGSYVALERNDGYWREGASIARVNITTVDDMTTRLNQLNSGLVDSAIMPREWEAELSANLLGLNQDINMSGNPANGSDTIPSDFFADRDVRLAFAYAYNLQASIDELFQSGALPVNGIIPRGMSYYNHSVPYYSYNLFTAADHLNHAQTGEGDTWGERGFRITLFYPAGSGLSDGYDCLALERGLEALTAFGLVQGEINVTVQPMNGTQYLRAIEGNALAVFSMGWSPDYADPDDNIRTFVHSNGSYASRCGIDNATLNAMCERAAVELNETQRAMDYYDISMAVYENCYYIRMVQETGFHVERTWVSGYHHNAMRAGLYYYELSYAPQDEAGGVDRTYAIIGVVGIIAATIIISIILNKRLKR